MKTNPPRRFHLHRGMCLALLTGGLAAGLAGSAATPPNLQPLVRPGRWPAWPRGGSAYEVKVAG